MAILIQMRLRIKAIQTIKKITHAMRLISMSTHTRLRAKDTSIKEYNKQISSLFFHVKQAYPHWNNQFLYPADDITIKPLYILVGSQKGLCGNFNSALFSKFEKVVAKHELEPFYVIAIGKKAVDFIKKKQLGTILLTFSNLNSALLPEISQKIIDEIITMGHFFSSVTVVSNVLKTFFIQKPQVTQLIPFQTQSNQEDAEDISEYMWEQAPEMVLDFLAYQTVQAYIQYLLFQSVFAEQAARFISMDNATRNADTLLEDTTMQYNKLRQFKITKELTELTGSF